MPGVAATDFTRFSHLPEHDAAIVERMVAMAKKPIAALLNKNVRRFAAARDGGVATILGIAAIPLMAAVGAAVDYSLGTATKAAMQAALDSAALNLVQNPEALASDQLSSKATALFTAMFNSPKATNTQVTAQFDPATAILTLNSSADLATTFMGLIGIKSMQIAALSDFVSCLRLARINPRHPTKQARRPELQELRQTCTVSSRRSREPVLALYQHGGPSRPYQSPH